MNSTFYFPKKHPLKKEIRYRRLKLWQLRNLTGVSESKLSRYLNGVDPMPFQLEQRLERILRLLNDSNKNN
jgi:hypothetical protein